MKKLLIFPVIILCFFLSGCYDASEVEETAYLIALGIDNGKTGGYNYTFQFAAPLAISGGGDGGGESGSSSDKTDGLADSKNSTVKNVVIAAPDFYTAKNMLANYLSKTLNMSHLKLIVCSEEFAGGSLEKHTELFSQEREIRPGTFVAVSSVSAEEFLKSVNPDLEGSTSKYYELSNSGKTLIYAPSVRLGDFINNSKTFDKSSVLPIAEVSNAVSSEELTAKESGEGIQKSSVSRVSNAAPELYGMGIFKDSILTGKMTGDEALMYNILSGQKSRFTFSVKDTKKEGESLSFNTLILKKPHFKISEKDGSLYINVTMYTNTEFIGTVLPEGYNSSEELLDAGEKALCTQMTEFLFKTSRELSADILKTERYYKKNFMTIREMDESNFDEKYKNASFTVNIKRSNKGGSSLSGEMN